MTSQFHDPCEFPENSRTISDQAIAMPEYGFDLGPEIPADGYPFPLLRHILELGPFGTAVEFGVGAGDSIRLIAEQMPVVGFDSFHGLPEDWRPEFPSGSLKFPIPHGIPNCRLVIGLFDDTCWSYPFGSLGEIGLVHLDADLYSSTATALRHVGKHFRPGTYVVFDEFFGYPGCEEHEQKAWRQYVTETGIEYDVIGHSGEEWAARIK
jgi:hypothetical protein